MILAPFQSTPSHLHISTVTRVLPRVCIILCCYLLDDHQFHQVLKHNDLVAKLIPFVLNRLYVASMLLTDTLDTVLATGTLSSPTSDLYKNVALGWMRLNAVVDAMAEHGSMLEEQLQQDPSSVASLLSWSPIGESPASSEQIHVPASAFIRMTPSTIINQRKEINALAYRVIHGFVNEYPTNPDVNVFRTFVAAIQL